jgi:hypothetical protein
MNSKTILRNYIRVVLQEAVPAEKNVTSVGAPPESTTRQKPKATSTADVTYEIEEAFINASGKERFSAMVTTAEALDLNMIGAGSSRIVYDLGGDYVLKLARDEKGLAQNELEAFAGRDPQVDRIVAKVKDSSDEYAWLVSQKATQLVSEKEFTDSTGVEWNDLRAALGMAGSEDLEATAKPTRNGAQKGPEAGGGCPTGQKFLEYLQNYLKRYSTSGGMLVGDIAKYDSWGRTKNGCIVLLDYGITLGNFQKLYRQRPAPRQGTGGKITLGKRKR